MIEQLQPGMELDNIQTRTWPDHEQDNMEIQNPSMFNKILADPSPTLLCWGSRVKSEVRWSWTTAATVWSNAAKSRVLNAIRWASWFMPGCNE